MADDTFVYDPSLNISQEEFNTAVSDFQAAALRDQAQQAWMRENEPWRYTAQELANPVNLWGGYYDPTVQAIAYAPPLVEPITVKPETEPFYYPDGFDTSGNYPAIPSDNLPDETLPGSSGFTTESAGIGGAIAAIVAALVIGMMAKK